MCFQGPPESNMRILQRYRIFFLHRCVFFDKKGMNLTRIRAQDFEVQFADVEGVALVRDAAELVGDESADGVDAVVFEFGAERFVEVFHFGQGRNPPAGAVGTGFQGDDFVNVLFLVELVFDVADDLFKHVFDGDKAGNAAEFVDDDGHVVMVVAEVAQQHVQPFGFGDENGGMQDFTD